MGGILRVGRQGSRISAVRSERQPGRRISQKAGEGEEEKKEGNLKSVPSGQRNLSGSTSSL
jgi:hypothetical protein